MPSVLWSNGQVDTGATWEELEDKVRLDQWWSLTPDEFRIEMQKRAYRWALAEIVTAGSSEMFFGELARAGLVKFVDDDWAPSARKGK